MDETILGTIKNMVVGNKEDNDFDSELKLYINRSLTTLYQNGVGSSEFQIVNGNETWEEFIPDCDCFGAIKNYIYLDTLIVFDPPTSSIVMETYKQLRDEALWRVKTEMELGRDNS